MAEGVDAADQAVVATYQAGPCPAAIDAELARCVGELEEQTTILRSARALLVSGESIVDEWQASGEEPHDWSDWLRESLRILDELTATLISNGTQIPNETLAARRAVR